MKLFPVTLLALCGMSATSFASPVDNSGALNQREATSTLNLVTELYGTIQQYTGAINSTVANLTKGDITPAENATAHTTVNNYVTDLTSAIQQASIQVTSLSRKMVRRDDNSTLLEIAAVVDLILLDINGTFDFVIGIIGLGNLLNFANPLSWALNLLLVDIDLVEKGVLADVAVLTDGILFSIALGELEL